MSSHSYAADFPNSQVDPAISSFFESFYAASDRPNVIESYAEFFTPDASLTMASKSASGKEEIVRFRQSMWGTVKSRKHTVHKIFSFGVNSYEVAILGSADFTLTNDKTLQVPWAANAELVKDGELKMRRYHVYMDTAPVAAALQ